MNKAYERLLADDREWLMRQEQFRRLLFELYSAAGITRTTREEQQRLYHEGKRSLGLEILGWFSATPEDPIDAIAVAIEAKRQLNPEGVKHDDRDYPE